MGKRSRHGRIKPHIIILISYNKAGRTIIVLDLLYHGPLNLFKSTIDEKNKTLFWMITYLDSQ